MNKKYLIKPFEKKNLSKTFKVGLLFLLALNLYLSTAIFSQSYATTVFDIVGTYTFSDGTGHTGKVMVK